MPMTHDEKLAAKRADQAKRDARNRAADKRLAALPADVAERIRANAATLQTAARANGDRSALINFTEQALALHEATQAQHDHAEGEETFHCRTCEQDKPLSDRPNHRGNQCRGCYNAKWREWDRKRREAKAAAAQVSA